MAVRASAADKGTPVAIPEGRVPLGPFTFLACALITGIILGHWVGDPRSWLTLAIILIAVTWVAVGLRRRLLARRLAVLSLIPIAAGWIILWQQHVPADSIARYVTEAAQLARVTGVVENEPRLATPQHGAFARFSRGESPPTLFLLRLQSVTAQGRQEPASGILLVKMRQVDLRLHAGDRIAAFGWLSAIEGPRNPGDRDFPELLRQRGIEGRLLLNSPENYQILDPPRDSIGLSAWRTALANTAAFYLHLGLRPQPTRLALLDALLLGRWGDALTELQPSFRRTGLIHLLSISGAHMAILLGLVWAVARLAVPHPARAALLVLLVLLLYLLVLPWQVSILRAGVMAGLFCLTYATGRRAATLDTLALACVLLLLWRPQDLFQPGFQLSFGVTAGLLLFPRRVSHWLWPLRLITPKPFTWEMRLMRRTADLLAVNLTGFLVATPIVAYHFGVISPISIILSILVLPVATAAIGLGFTKMFLGLLLPSSGLLLARPLEWSADGMVYLTQFGAHLPGAALELDRPPNLWWTLTAEALALLLLTGWLGRRYLLVGGAVGLCLAWLAASENQPWLERHLTRSPLPVLRLNMLAVGDGSCYLLRIPDQVSGNDRALMFDCGSGGFLDIGAQSIAPTLKRLGVKRLDALLLSHVDLDHIGGALDLADRVPVTQVCVTPQFLEEARHRPDGPAAFLLAGLRDRQIPVTTVSQGWTQRFGQVQLDLLWPPVSRVFTHNNDTSLVLSIRTPTRRVLLNGDIQQEALTGLLAAATNLHADVTDLPHHGSFVRASPQWLIAAAPQVVLQSSGPARLRKDKWHDLIEGAGVVRLVTHRLGMVELTVEPNGEMHWSSFQQPNLATNEPESKNLKLETESTQ